jgi:hypothetical protein
MSIDSTLEKAIEIYKNKLRQHYPELSEEDLTSLTTALMLKADPKSSLWNEALFQAVQSLKNVDANQHHELKVYQEYFDAIKCGAKNFEVRKNDRDFQTGDTLNLSEFNPHTQRFTGRAITRVVSYVFPGGQFGIEEGYVVLGLKSE